MVKSNGAMVWLAKFEVEVEAVEDGGLGIVEVVGVDVEVGCFDSRNLFVKISFVASLVFEIEIVSLIFTV